ncbi:hypothetical protein HK100_010029, partial [Physocladia obscura]
MGDNTQILAVGYDPFTATPMQQGQNWTLPTLASLNISSSERGQGSGFGCFVAPTAQIGVSFYVDSCPPAYFCPYVTPDPDTFPVLCPAAANCAVDRLFGLRCLPQGLFEPMLCWPGFYCSDPSVIYACPEGSYWYLFSFWRLNVVSGTIRPVKCRPFSSCPAGTITERNFGLLYLLAGFDTALFILILSSSLRDRFRTGHYIFPHISALRTKSSNSESVSKFTFASIFTGLRSNFNNNIAASASSSNTAVSNVFEDSFDSEDSPFMFAFRKSFSGKKMNIKFNDLKYSFGGKVVLNKVSGEFNAGRLIAVIGPSGAGKTTFLNTLMGKVPKTSGTITVNGVVARLSTLRQLIGYVPQDDIMMRELTVKEIILYSAKMRLPRTWSSKRVNDFVDTVINTLNLEKVAHSIIGDELKRGISGGQRKRVNIGMELAAAPLALFLDEPTSGVDSTSALQIIKTLQKLAQIGLTVVCIVHQPGEEMFKAFDDVLMLESGGKLAYSGPLKEAKIFFELQGYNFSDETNLAHSFMDILSGYGKKHKNALSISEELQISSGSDETRPIEQSGLSPSSETLATTPTSGNEETAVVSDHAVAVVVAAEEDKEDNAFIPESLKPLQKSRGASFLWQIYYCHNRSLLQQIRAFPALLTELLVAVGAGIIIGIAVQKDEIFHGLLNIPFRQLSTPSNDYMVALYGTLVGISVAMAAGPAGVRLFGENRLVFRRESAAGFSSLAYFV